MSDKSKKYIVLQGHFDDTLFNLLEKRKGYRFLIPEGRPGLESARASARSLQKRKIRPVLITDNMAGFMFYKNLVKEVWLSYEVADSNGALCQIGGLILGVLGKKHNVPVHAAPSGVRTRMLADRKEILYFNGKRVAPPKINGYVPLVEWVPHEYITKVYQ